MRIPSMLVIAETSDAVYVRLDESLQRPCEGGCSCDWCKSHPSSVPTWDTLAIPLRPFEHGDKTWTVHMPNPHAFQTYYDSKKRGINA